MKNSQSKRKKITKKREKKKEKKIKEKIKKAEEIIKEVKREKYFQAVGRRKTAVARVRIFPKRTTDKNEKENFLVNGKPLNKYFPISELQKIVISPLETINSLDRFQFSVLVRGGGLKGQAEAIRHGLARALVLCNPNFQKPLKKAGYLTRDPRMKERKKFGLKRARRAPQWQKR